MFAGIRASLPRGTFALAAVRFMLYLGVQASYFIGIIGTLTYQLHAGTGDIAMAVGLFNLFIIAGNTAGGSLLDTHGPKAHTAVALGVAVASSALFQAAGGSVAAVLAMSAAFGFATGVGYAYLSAYPAYLSDDAEQRKRMNAIMSVVSNVAVVVGPAVGGIIATFLPSQRVFAFTAVLSALALVPAGALLRRIGASARAGERERGDSQGPEGSTLADSTRTVFAAPSLALLFWVGVLAYAGYGAFDPLESLYYRDVLQVDISWMGWLSSAAGLGSVVGALAAMRVPRRWVNVRTLMLLIAFEGAACVLYVGTSHVGCAIAGQLLLGCAFGMVTPLQHTLVQMHAPLHLLGRVNSVMNAGFSGAGAVPLFAAPVLAHLFGVQGVLIGASCVVLLVPLIVMVARRSEISRLVTGESA